MGSGPSIDSVPGRLSGKVALISGASAGQGAAEAALFVEEGARVVLADIDDAAGSALATELGDQTIYCHLDVTREEAWREAVHHAVGRFGRLDILVNNAGGTGLRHGSVDGLPMEDYDFVIDLNQRGPWLGIRAATSAMREAGGGSIINISSIGGFIGLAGLGAYSAAKWAVRGMSRTAAVELAPDGIRVNTVHPGFIDTPGSSSTGLPQIVEETGAFRGVPVPLRRAGRPIEVARVVLFLASDESSYCTGAEFVVDGGVLAGGWTPF
jgi:3alpha(or 20beta)-hydroxysteroid dehydrogenase